MGEEGLIGFCSEWKGLPLVSSFVYSRERFESDNFKDTISAYCR